jgi:hypothetical protein
LGEKFIRALQYGSDSLFNWIGAITSWPLQGCENLTAETNCSAHNTINAKVKG